MKHLFSIGLLLLVLGMTQTSCVNTQKTTYFNGMKDSAVHVKDLAKPMRIHQNDILSITVSSINPEASILFNQPQLSAGAGANATTVTAPSGYLVDQSGYIQFPILGKIKAEGKTKDELTREIASSLEEKKLLVGPIVTIRFQNFRVTVLGEVARPSVFTIPNERVTLLEAIGLAGDLTVYARRDNVMIIREVNNVRMVKRLNMNNDELFTSPYYYLEANDVVYVETNKTKVANSGRGMQTASLIVGTLSIVAIVVDRLTSK